MDYTKLAATAKRLIQKSGALIVWVAQDDPTPVDTTTPWKVSPTPSTTETKVYGVVLPMKRESSPFLSMMKDADDIPKGEAIVLIAGNQGFEPDITGLIQLGDGTTYRPLKIKTLRPALTSVLHIVYVAR
jgi:hypothetical protein